MKRSFLIITIFLFLIDSLSGQLANWTAYLPSKFPTNRSGQIHGQARISQMKFHPSNANKMYAVTSQGGLFISSDGAENWTVAPGTDVLAVRFASVCIDHTDDNIIYLGGGDPDYYSSGAGLYKSTNGGASFTQQNTGIPTSRLVVNIIMADYNRNVMVAATNGGIYKTSNGGTTWTAKTATSLQFSDLKALTNGNTVTLFACTRTTSPELYRSEDFGETWTVITSGITTPSVATIQSGSRVAVTPADTNVVYLGFVSSGGMIFKSTDKGLNFTLMKAGGSPYLTYYEDDAAETGQGNYNFAIGVDRNDASKIWLQSHATWVSSNSGTNWSLLTNWWEKVHTDMHQIGQSPYDATKLYSCNDGGVWVSTDGGNNWTPKNDGIYAYEIPAKAGKSSPTRRDFVVIGTQDNGGLYADSTGWSTNRGGDDYAPREIDKRANSTAEYRYGSPSDFGAYQVGNRRINPTDSYTSYNSPNTIISDLVFNRTDINLSFLGLGNSGQRHVYRCTDVQNSTPTWVQISNFGTDATIQSIHSCIANANRLYVITNDQKIYVSNDALAASPTFSSYALTTSSNTIGTIATMANNADIVYISINNKVYRSANGGQNWVDNTFNLPSVNHTRIVAEEYGGANELVFVATNTAVYYKKAGQTTWTIYSTNLPTRKTPTDFSIFDDGTNNARLRFTSYGRGMWETPFGNLRPLQAIASAWSVPIDPCNGNTFVFKDISNGNNVSTSWSFPTGTPSNSTATQPTVTFATAGTHTAILTVTDANNVTSTTNISVTVTRVDNCSPDAYAGKSLSMAASGDYFIKTNANLTNVTHFTTTAWIKPNGTQTRYAGIVSNGEWCAHCPTNTNGFVTDYNGTRLWYRWAGVDDTWASNSGLTLPLNVWSFVALVVTPDSVAIYMNDQKYVQVFSGTQDRPTAASFTDLYVGRGHYNNPNFKGEIDEVSVWNKALTQNEIREMRHLTKTSTLLTNANLIAYFQFNETYGLTNQSIVDKKRAYHGSMVGAAILANSTAPVAGGASHRMLVNSGGVKTFTGTDCQIQFPASGAYPNNEVVVSRLDVSPDQNPASGTPLSNKYWIVNNYGTNSFTNLTNISFSNLGTFGTGAVSNFSLFKRGSNDVGATWGTAIDVADVLTTTNNNTLTFSTGNNITSFSQFTLAKKEIKLAMKIFLEGAYSGGTMTTNLTNSLPTTEPYTGMTNFAHQNGGGGEMTTLSIITANNIVDWVFVELTSSSGTVYTRSALLKNDGSIVDTNGVSPLSFVQALEGSYTITIKHRNHLKIKTSSTVALDASTKAIDFTNNTQLITGVLKLVASGVYALYAGDVNADGQVNATDRSNTWNARNLSGYNINDCSLNGTVDATDRSQTWNNRNLSSGF
jgi:Concanavalin A-like lectin/glucanases superfamily/PKD domain